MFAVCHVATFLARVDGLSPFSSKVSTVVSHHLKPPGQIGIVSETGVFNDDKASHWASSAAAFGAKRTWKTVRL